MNLVDTAKEQIKHAVERVAEKVTDTVATDSRIQAVTIARPRHEVVEFFQDSNRLSEVFGDVAEVSSIGPNHLRWKFVFHDAEGPDWECVVVVEDESRVRYVSIDSDRSAEIVLDMRDAPQERGTEVIARISSPAPGALTGALAFKALYRARALLLTGEVPTIRHNPGARASDR